MGDRNFGVFSVAYDAQAKGHDVLFRLTKTRFLRYEARGSRRAMLMKR